MRLYKPLISYCTELILKVEGEFHFGDSVLLIIIFFFNFSTG